MSDVKLYADPSEYAFERFGATYAPQPDHRCPTCDSPSPERHPAMAHEGEIELCIDAYHLIPTNANRPSYIEAVRAKIAAKSGGDHD